MRNRVSVSLLITTVVIAMTVTFSITMIMAMRLFDNTVTSVKQKESMYNKLAEVDKYVRAHDYYEIDESTLYDMMASGYLLGTGDRYARYYTAAAYTELVDIRNGKLVGIGADVVKDVASGYGKVIKVYAGSPAADLGIEKGCYITLIDEVDTKTLSSSDSITAKLRGETGTPVAISWLDADNEQRSEVVTRRGYTTGTVEYSLEGGRYGYIKVTQFDGTTASGMDYAINTLTAAGATSLIFDLRNNAGSDFEAVIECLDLLCPEADIATLVYKNGTSELLGSTHGEQKTTLPIVCIVNGGTSSAAELFAYTARELASAKLVGETTMGKGTVQSNPQRLSDGSAVVVTVGRLLTCTGESFDGTGLTVDVDRALTSDELLMFYDFTLETDPQILRAFDLVDSINGESTVAGGNSAAAGTTDNAAPAEGSESQPAGE